MFKRFCTIFIIFAFALPMVAALCMLLLWGLELLGIGDVGSVRAFIVSMFRVIPFTSPVALTADAAYFSPGNYVTAMAGSLAKGFLSAVFVGGVMYLIDGFLGKKIYKDMTQILAKLFGLVVGALILRFTNLLGELTAIITRYTLVVIIIVLILVLTRVLFMRHRAFSIMSIVKSLLRLFVNAVLTVVLCCYLAAFGSLAVAEPLVISQSILNVILIFLVSGVLVAAAFVVDKLVAIDMK